jgi:hypothetical protein
MYRSIVCVCVMFTAPAASDSATILESATFVSPTGPVVGIAVKTLFYLGARFHLDQETLIDHIGGELSQGDDPAATTFGAIAALTPSGFPSGDPLTFQPLAVTTFVAPEQNLADLLVPLSVTLPPGDYALIFGTGRFGATTNGSFGASSAFPYDNVNTPQASYFGSGEYDNDTGQFSQYVPWGNLTDPRFNFRFLVTGTPVPEPSTMVLAALGGLTLLAYRRRKAGVS